LNGVVPDLSAGEYVISVIRERLQHYQPREFPQLLPEAAVLMPFTDEPEPRLILTVRAKSMPTHGGEVAFPGGKRDPGDQDLLATALREAEEEVGLAGGAVDILGQLSVIPSRYGMRVTPFVGLVAPDVRLVAEPGEIQSIFRVPLQFFLDEPPGLSAPIDVYGKKFCVPAYYYEGNKIWGLTAFMIIELINHVFDAGIPYEVMPRRDGVSG